MQVEWEKSSIQELDITATDLSTECLIDMLTRIPSLKFLSAGQINGFNDSVSSRSNRVIVSPDSALSTLDLKDAYYLIPIHQDYRRFLSSEFQKELYEFTCLSFGLCTTPYVFTKLLNPVVQKLRSEGFLSVLYLDDFLLIASSVAECITNVPSSGITRT